MMKKREEGGEEKKFEEEFVFWPFKSFIIHFSIKFWFDKFILLASL